MNKHFFLIIGLLFIGLNAQAQMHFGIKGGVNRGQMQMFFRGEHQEEDRYQARYSGHVGVYGTLDLSKRFLINAELLYSNKGNKAYSYMSGENFDLHLNYLTLPVLVGYKPFSRLSVMVGPEVGYLLSSENEEQLNLNWPFASNLKANPFELGLTANIRFQVWKNLNLDMRYIHGLTPVVTESVPANNMLNDNSMYEITYYVRTFQLSLAYQLK